MIFWISIIGLMLIALAILLIPLFRVSRSDEVGSDEVDQRLQQNIQIAREKKQALDAQLDEGEIDQPAYDAAFIDLQTSLALDLQGQESATERTRGKWMALVVLAAIPFMSMGLYFSFGEYRVIENPHIAEVRQAQETQSFANMSLDEMVVAIQDKLRDNPDDARGWYALGRTQMARQQYGEAVNAFQKTYEIVGEDAEIMFSLADALALQNGGVLLGEPEALIKRGLKLAPRYPNGLWLAGLAAEQREDFKSAHRYWSLLLPLIADDQNSAREIETMIAILEQRDPDLVPAQTPMPTLMPTPTAGRSITLEVDIDADLKSQAKPGDAVFVYAKAMQGPPMPLAVKKLRLSDLPASLTLSDADAMMPSMKLSSFEQVIVGARVSKSGNPIAQAGDFFTELEGVNSADPPGRISLVIDRVK
jgi:cytochrome c-type biogenesis protein CcmH